jgi:hypothetical protein
VAGLVDWELHHTTLFRFSASIPSAVNPNSASASLVCSPDSGGHWRPNQRAARRRSGRTDTGEIKHGEAGQGLRGVRNGHQGLRADQVKKQGSA